MFKKAPPFESVLALCPEEVHVVLELQLEYHVLLDSVLRAIRAEHPVTQQGKTCQRKVILNMEAIKHIAGV